MKISSKDLIVIGQFCVGKSTVINAILESGILPVSSREFGFDSSCISFGDNNTISIQYRDDVAIINEIDYATYNTLDLQKNIRYLFFHSKSPVLEHFEHIIEIRESVINNSTDIGNAKLICFVISNRGLSSRELELFDFVYTHTLFKRNICSEYFRSLQITI